MAQQFGGTCALAGIHACYNRTVSPMVAQIAPLACLPISPVSKVICNIWHIDHVCCWHNPCERAVTPTSWPAQSNTSLCGDTGASAPAAWVRKNLLGIACAFWRQPGAPTGLRPSHKLASTGDTRTLLQGLQACIGASMFVSSVEWRRQRGPSPVFRQDSVCMTLALCSFLNSRPRTNGHYVTEVRVSVLRPLFLSA